ncbi:hypothetical protein ACNTMW_19715 [Planosporangium sp. 12N6]|uniref:hypothetical protein n=1 Tax=Planosporangium spinosum TaxID=3402278 RepID=UPI003CEDBF36
MPVTQKPLHIMWHAVTIEVALIAFTVLVIAVLLAPEGRHRLRALAARVAESRFRRVRLRAQAAELHRYAEELRVAASRAEVTAERRHREWTVAHQTREAAWQAFEAADAAARRASLAAAYPLPSSADDPDDRGFRERYLHDAATAAYQRGELTAEQLADVLAHRNGWDPRRHPCEQEAMLRRAGRQRMLAAYRTAAEMERAARHAADTAAAARRSLDDEAFAAGLRARQASVRLAAELPRRQRTALAARVPAQAELTQRVPARAVAAQAASEVRRVPGQRVPAQRVAALPRGAR